MWALGPATSPTAATTTTWGAGTTGTITLGAAEDLFEPPLWRPVVAVPTLPRAPRLHAPRGRDPRLLRHALARMRRAA